MIELSPLHLKRAAEALLVANTPAYVLNSLLRSGYPQTLTARHSSVELKRIFAKAAVRCDFESNDDVVMILAYLALALKGEFDMFQNLPRPKVEPRFLRQIAALLPQVVPNTRLESVSVNPSLVEYYTANRSKASFQKITLEGI